MSAKTPKKNETLAVRSSRRIKGVSTHYAPELQPEPSLREGDSAHLCPALEDPRQQELKFKLDKDSTSPLSLEIPTAVNLSELTRRHPRHPVDNCRPPHPDIDLQVDPFTFDDHSHPKTTLEHSLPNLTKAHSSFQPHEPLPSDCNPSFRKSTSKACELQSPYSDIRKSYRKHHRREIISLPYRKCHDAFEGRVVTIINKLQLGKNCQKDLEGLADKLAKISNKDMMNRFVVAGVSTIVALIRDGNCIDKKLKDKLQAEHKTLQMKITQELENFQSYELEKGNENDHAINIQEYKTLMIRKLYKINKKKYADQPPQTIRERTIEQCERLLSESRHISHYVAYMRVRMGQILP